MRIRKLAMIIIVCTVLFTLGSSIGFCADVAKIGTLNFQRIFENSEAGKAAKNKMTAEFQRMESDLKQKGEEIKALEETLKRNVGVMSKEAQEEKRWEMERKISDVKALKKKYDRKLQELEVQVVKKIRQDLIQLIQEYGKKEGYLLILENSSVVYAPKTLDITDHILQQYNEQYAKQGKSN